MPFEHDVLVAVALKCTGLVLVELFAGLVKIIRGVVANTRPLTNRTEIVNQNGRIFPLII